MFGRCCKSTIIFSVLILIPVFLLNFCAPLPPPLEGEAFQKEKKSLDTFIFKLRNNIRKGNTDSLLPMLAPDARSWLREMIWLSRDANREDLADRPFYEVLFTLALRVKQRQNPGLHIDEAEALKLMFTHGGPAYKAVIRNEFGPPTIRGYQAKMGVSQAPHVPIFYFTREGEQWKFDLVKSLPLVVRELESVARNRRDHVVDQAIWVLKAAGQWEHIPELEI